MYVNDIDDVLSNSISKFADDTKIGNSIIDDHDRLGILEDIKKIFRMVWKVENAL